MTSEETPETIRMKDSAWKQKRQRWKKIGSFAF